MKTLSQYLKRFSKTLSQGNDEFHWLENALQALRAGKIEEASQWIETVKDEMNRSHCYELETALFELMKHIIFITENTQNQYIEIWLAQISKCREEIAYHFYNRPDDFNQQYLLDIWEKSFNDALEVVIPLLEKPISISTLSWEDVFEKNYTIYENKPRFVISSPI